VTVTVGEVLHPMSASHFIQYVEIFAGNEPAGRMEFRPGFNQPKAVFYPASGQAGNPRRQGVLQPARVVGKSPGADPGMT